MHATKTIDFEPASIGAILPRDGYLAIVFPAQIMFGESKDDRPLTYPLMLCELQLLNGKANPELPEFPLVADNIRVAYKGGERRYFLPEEFQAEGPVHVYAEIGSTLVLLAEGNAVSFKVLSQVGVEPVTYEPRSGSDA
jgi:hypothetical protein